MNEWHTTSHHRAKGLMLRIIAQEMSFPQDNALECSSLQAFSDTFRLSYNATYHTNDEAWNCGGHTHLGISSHISCLQERTRLRNHALVKKIMTLHGTPWAPTIKNGLEQSYVPMFGESGIAYTCLISIVVHFPETDSQGCNFRSP